MKKAILEIIVMLVICLSIPAIALAESGRNYNQSIGDIEGIDFIQEYLPETYNHIFSEWSQTNRNQILSVRANKLSLENKGEIETIYNDIDALNAGIAGAMAAASLPTADRGKNSFMIGAGIYNSQAAIAVGLSGNTGDGAILKFSFTRDTGGNSGASAGASFEF